MSLRQTNTTTTIETDLLLSYKKISITEDLNTSHTIALGTVASSTLTTTVTSTIHASPDIIMIALTTSLGTLMLPASSITSLNPTSTSFTHHLIVSKSASGKPIYENFSFFFEFGLQQPPDPNTFIITTVQPKKYASVNKHTSATRVHLDSFIITLEPRAHTTTFLTATASMSAISSPSSILSLTTLNSGDSVSPQLPSTRIAQVILDHVTGFVPRLYHQFARSAEIDEATYFAFETLIAGPTCPPLQPHEDSLITRSLQYNSDFSNFKRVPGTILDTVAYYQLIGADNDAWGKAVGTIDTGASRALAWFFCLETPGRKEMYIEEDGTGLLRRTVDLDNSRSTVSFSMSRFGLGVADRVFVSWFAWRKEPDGSIILAFAPAEEHPDPSVIELTKNIIRKHPCAAKGTRGSLRGYWKLQPMAAQVCEVTLVIQGKMAGRMPRVLLNMRIKSVLGYLKWSQNAFGRKGDTVDEEVRAAFPSPPDLAQLTAEQSKIFDDCRLLLADGPSQMAAPRRHSSIFRRTVSPNSSEYQHLQSPSPFIKMSHKSPRGSRRIAIGRATTSLDCSAHEAMAWWSATCSRRRTKISYEEGNPARIVAMRSSAHDEVFATVKSFPFPLADREFVGRQLAAREPNGDFVMAFVSTDDEINYGVKLRTVRATTKWLIYFKSVAEMQCEVTFMQYFDGGGNVPKRVYNYKLQNALGAVEEMRSEFERDDEIDKLEHEEIAKVVREVDQVYTAEENEIIEQVMGKLGGPKEEDFDELDSPDLRVKMGRLFAKSGGGGTLRASTVIDAAIEDCLATHIAFMDRAHVRDFAGVTREYKSINDHHMVAQVIHDFGLGFSKREWVSSTIWKWVDSNRDTLRLVCTSVEDEDYPLDEKFLVRASTEILSTYQKLPEKSGVPQTKLTFVFELDLGGRIPKRVYNSEGWGISQLVFVSKLRVMLDKSKEIEAAVRAQNVDMIRRNREQYSQQELTLVELALMDFKLFEEKRAKNVKMESALTTAKVAFKKGDKHAWGWATTTVRASPEEVLAHCWDFELLRTSREYDLERSVDKRASDHHVLFYTAKKVRHKLIHDREFLSRFIWRRDGMRDSYALVSRPAVSERRPVSSALARAQYPSAMKIKKKSETETIIEYVIHPGGGGKLPAFVLNRTLKSSLCRLTDIREYFQELKGLEEWEGEDGRCVGEAMCTPTKAEMHNGGVDTRMHAMFDRYEGLREFGRKHEFFEAMMARVVKNNLRLAGEVSTKLCNMSKNEGKAVGAGLAMALATNLTAETGVDDWIRRYPCLGELDREAIWFRHMANAVGQRLLGEVGWGLKFRVFTGAFLSILDMATDLSVISQFLSSDEEREFGWALLCMVATNLGLQWLICVFQTSGSKMKLLKGTLVVLTGLKPAFDAHAVASGAEEDEHAAITPVMEHVYAKGAELIAENIPGCILQFYALIRAEQNNRTNRAIASILISAATAGYTSACMSFDADANPTARFNTPEFYGYIPDGGGRAVIFAAMVANSALLLLLRSFSAAMLMMSDSRYFTWYFAGDMAVYLGFKVLRGDFTYWVPVSGFMGFLASLLTRTGVKTITDYTGLLHFRHVYEMGGAYWSINMVLAVLASYASVWVYFAKGGTTLGEEDTWTLVEWMSGGFGVTFGVVLLMMKKKYRRTFWNFKRGKDLTIERFDSDDDSVKAIVIGKNEMHWRSIRDDVEQWVREGWWRWKEDKPEWFNENFKSRVPLSWIPEDDNESRASWGSRGVSSTSSGTLLRDVFSPGGGGWRVHPIGGKYRVTAGCKESG